MHVLPSVTVSDIPKTLQASVELFGADIDMVHQKTGFGQRRYFLCPRCGRKCGKLYYIADTILCAGCSPVDLYRLRRNLYDEGGTALITYHMRKIAATLSRAPLKFPFHYCNYPIEPPPGMSHRRYRDTLLKLQALENMRFAAIFLGARFTGRQIREYTSKAFLSLFNLYQLSDYVIFGTEMPPRYYTLILDDAPEKPLNSLGPLCLKVAPELAALVSKSP